MPAPRPMSWPMRLAAILGLEACWFALLHPMVPSSLAGFAAEFLVGLVVFALIYGAVRTIVWLQGRPINMTLNRTICIAIALGVGVGIFAAAYWFRMFMGRNFTYWH